MHKIEMADLNNKIHYAIAYKAIDKNKELFLDDTVKDIHSYLHEIKEGLKNGNFGCFYYIDDKLYSAIYVTFDRYKNATLNFTLFETNNFFKTTKMIKFLVDHLFKNCKANKIKANIYPFEHLAEAVYRYVGLKKEGILRDEITLAGKPMTLINLAMTKKDFIYNSPIDRKNFVEIIRKIKNVKK